MARSTKTVEPFKPEWLAESILQKLLAKDVVVDHKYDKAGSNAIFEKNKPCDYFVLVLQGKVQAEVGKEMLVFESGPFSFFGIQALQCLPQVLTLSLTSLNSLSSLQSNFYGRTNMYVPDFSVKCVTDCQYLKIHRAHYIAARQATQVHRHSRQRTHSSAMDNADDAFTKEWTKLKLSHRDHSPDDPPSYHSEKRGSAEGGHEADQGAEKVSLNSVDVMLPGRQDSEQEDKSNKGDKSPGV